MITRHSLLRNILLLLAGAFMQACNTEKNLQDLVYFNRGGDSMQAAVVQNYEPVIKAGDRLSITVNALNPVSTAPYNLTSPGGASALNYLVDETGNIRFPQLGSIKAAGFTRRELTESLTSVLAKFVTNPLVIIEIINFKITVLGDVNAPGTLPIPEAKITLLEAIGRAGDLTLSARRDNITVIRENNGIREFGKVNLLSKDVFKSPYFVLKQGDVVYVQFNKAKASQSDQSFVRNLGITTAIISLASTLIVLVVNLTR